jgi:hypothetical protein
MPQEVVDRILTLAGVKNGDLLYDLGSGDGRVLIAAAKRYGAEQWALRLIRDWWNWPVRRLTNKQLKQRVELRHQDFMTVELSSASVVTLYLSHDGNTALKPLLLRPAPAGCSRRIVHLDMGDWPPKIIESYRDGAGNVHTLYFWEMAQPAAYNESRRELFKQNPAVANLLA